MALLYSLEIIGIRNFSPEDKQTISFSTPVVLFQGQNGSGKTTILECIRYALTGELPSGTSNGQGFLNEPKMSNKSSTKASIKLKFYDSEGNMITVARVLQVQTQKNGNLQFKRLNFSVRKRDKNIGTVQDISGRCIDIDSYCSSVLNVSKSIFNNVLFCHQENSLWPLDEPKKLKEKFDEIFDAVRYNKCVDTIRKFIKEKQAKIHVLNERLVSKKNIKIQVEKQRAKFEEKEEKLNEIKNSIETKINDLEPLRNRMKEILELEDNLGTLQGKLTAKEEEKKGLVRQQTTLVENISHIFEGTDEELQTKIGTFREEQSSLESAIRQLEKNIQNITKQINNLNLNLQNKQVQIGQMKEEQSQYNIKSEESKELIEKLRTELDVEDFGDKEILLGELSNVLNNQQKKFRELKQEKDIEEKKLQDKIDKIREQNGSTKQSISSKNLTINDCNKKLKEIKCKLEELGTSDTQLQVVKDRIEESQQNLTKIKNFFNENVKLQEIEELKEQIDQKEQFLDKLDKEYRILQRNYVTEQKLDSEKSIIIEKQGHINKIKTKHFDNLKTLFKDNVPEKNLKQSVLNIENQQEINFRNCTKNINNLEKELTTLNTTLSHHKSKLKSDQQELSINKRKVIEVCNGKNFSSLLEQTYANKEKYQKRKGYLMSARIMYEQFISLIEDKKCCPVCTTNFTQKTSMIPTIIQDLRAKIINVPMELSETETNLKKEETMYNQLQQLKTVNDDIQLMGSTKIPKLEKEISNLTEQFEDKSMDLAAEKASLEDPQKLINICKNLITDATLFDQYQTDINKAKASINDLEENIEKVPSKRSRHETEMQLDSVKGELSNIKNRYDNNKKMLDQHRDRCQDLNRKIQSEIQKQIDIQKLVQEKPLLDKQNTEYNEQILLLRTEIEDLELSLVSEENDLKMTIENKNSVIKTNRETLDNFQKKIISHQNAVSDIHKLEKSIKDYERKNGSNKLNDVVEELADLNVSLQNLERSKSETLSSISEKKESIAKKESDFRALKDNVILREKQKEEKKVVVEIEKLRQKIGGCNYRQIFDEKTNKTTEINRKEREINILNGQLEEIQNQHDELKFELEQPENKNAFNIYKNQYYEVTVNNLCVNDLTKYVNVLERSVLKFHEERMVQINRTIRNLWRTIYRGNDIDYIEIKTDENMGGGTNKRRTYTYKVVQVKSNIELDMRGRCSAGQKVLACLVIRMALAETFSAHCGILALDEPTTNLDRANISSLSDALSGLINSRENETHFQLLIITHDEEFLKSLTQVQSIDNFWQVKRSITGSSTVERHML